MSSAAPARASLPEALIRAVVAGGETLRRVRRSFLAQSPDQHLQNLLVQVVDPELLLAVVGPDHEDRWIVPLRTRYAIFKRKYPADWFDVEKVWKLQRAQWRRPAGGDGRRSRDYPAASDSASQLRVGSAGPNRRARAPRSVPTARRAAGAPAVRHVPYGRAPDAAPDEVVVTVAAEVDTDPDLVPVPRVDPADRDAPRDRRRQSAPDVAGSGSDAGVSGFGPRRGAPAAPPPPDVRVSSLEPGGPPADPSDYHLDRFIDLMLDSVGSLDDLIRGWRDGGFGPAGWRAFEICAQHVARLRERVPDRARSVR